MSFNKFTTFKMEKDDVEILDGNLMKTAGMKLPEGFNYDPDYLYLKVKAVSAGEYWGANKNDDYFPEAELKAWYKTFLSAHTFKNHENKKIENAIGDVLTAEWSDKMKCVYLVIRIDRRIAPSVVRGYEKGFMTDVSMGCRVDHVICSYCGQKAKTRFDYCDHLKTMKGKVMDNGKKVSEINIGPKFHDISAVLNGAERTAKVEGLYIHGDKVAFEHGSGSLEKVASMHNSLSNMDEFFKVASFNRTDSDMEVIASALSQPHKKETEDTSEGRKKIESKIAEKALQDVSQENIANLEKIVGALKENYTKYWDKEKCQEMGRKLRAIAKDNKLNVCDVLEQFLKVSDIAAINLSPLEIHDIFMEAMDFDAHDLRALKMKNSDGFNIDRQLDGLGDGISTSSAIRAANAIFGKCEDHGYDEFMDNPAVKIKKVIISTKPREFNNDSITREIFEKVLGDVMADRSNHRAFSIPRLKQISMGNIAPMDTSAHTAPVKIVRIKSANTLPSAIIPAIISAFISAAHERERVQRFNDGTLNSNIMKFANYIGEDVNPLEKVAVSRRKVLMTGIPITLAYSALQRSRLNNGEQINSFNRYVADNPTNAAFMYALFTKLGKTGINAYGPAVKETAKKLSGVIKKKASEYNMFKDDDIDALFSEKGYDSQQTTIVKYACALNSIGKEDVAEELLINEGLSYNDLQEYLKTASCCFKMDIEKNAGSFVESVGKSVLGDIVLDNTKKSSVAAAIPGYLADGIILAAIGKGLNSAAKKTQKGDITNV